LTRDSRIRTYLNNLYLAHKGVATASNVSMTLNDSNLTVIVCIVVIMLVSTVMFAHYAYYELLNQGAENEVGSRI
jgi:hypothetical protein